MYPSLQVFSPDSSPEEESVETELDFLEPFPRSDRLSRQPSCLVVDDEVPPAGRPVHPVQPSVQEASVGSRVDFGGELGLGELPAHRKPFRNRSMSRWMNDEKITPEGLSEERFFPRIEEDLRGNAIRTVPKTFQASASTAPVP